MSTNPKSFTVDVPVEVSEAFSDHADAQGYTKWKAIMGALKVYMVLPAEAQVCANNANTTVSDVRVAMEKAYEDGFRLRFLAALTPEEQSLLIERVKHIAECLALEK